jgi:hypothetical protein
MNAAQLIFNYVRNNRKELLALSKDTTISKHHMQFVRDLFEYDRCVRGAANLIKYVGSDEEKRFENNNHFSSLKRNVKHFLNIFVENKNYKYCDFLLNEQSSNDVMMNAAVNLASLVKALDIRTTIYRNLQRKNMIDYVSFNVAHRMSETLGTSRSIIVTCNSLYPSVVSFSLVKEIFINVPSCETYGTLFGCFEDVETQIKKNAAEIMQTLDALNFTPAECHKQDIIKLLKDRCSQDKLMSVASISQDFKRFMGM